nr:putative alpha/beta hydrolase [uncultured bacterium]
MDGLRLAYDDIGDGVVVVLLHAGIADRRMWRHQAIALRGRYRVLNLDLPGYGESGLPPGGYANHDAVAGLLDELDIAQAALVGCSFGGAVAIDTALAHPGRVSALALFGSAVSGHSWSEEFRKLQQSLFDGVEEDDLDAVAQAEVHLWVVGPGREPDDLDPELLAFATEMDRGALAAESALDVVQTRELAPAAIGRLGEIRVPTLVAVGAADVPEIRQLADLIAAEVPQATRLPDVPGAAHLLPLERPDVVNPVLREFLP